MRLPTMSREELISFFSEDLSDASSLHIVGNLKMALMFLDPVERDQLKQKIRASLSPANRDIPALSAYLMQSSYEDMMEEMAKEESALVGSTPQIERKPRVPQPPQQEKSLGASTFPGDYIQKDFPTNDHFDDEDTKDVERFQRHGARFTPHRFEELVDQLFLALPMEVQEEMYKEPFLKKRFETIFVTFFKDIRDELEMRQKLSASRTVGGMGLSHDAVDDLFGIINGEVPKAFRKLPKLILGTKNEGAGGGPSAPMQKETTAAQSSRSPEKIQSPVKTIADVKAMPEPRQGGALPKIPPLPQPPLSPIPPVPYQGVAPPPPQTPQEEAPLPTFQTAALRMDKLQPVQPVFPRKAPAVRRGNAFADIKEPLSLQSKGQQEPQKHKIDLISPSEEFSTLTIEDLRESGDLQKFTEKIIQKIEMLSKNNYVNRIKAIKAWKKSPLYRMYVEVGQKSLLKKMSIEDYLALTSSQGMQLTSSEFQAISGLNQKLRF